MSELKAQLPPDAALGSTNLNPPGMSLLALLREDYNTHGRMLFEQGLWAVALHRFGNWRMDRNKLLRIPLTLMYRMGFKLVQWTCGIDLPYTIRLGRRVRVWHHSGIILSCISIGDDTHLRQNTTIGLVRRDDPRHKRPVIGDRVDIGVGAVIVGHITIGDDAVIGANAVVTKDVPPWHLAAGVPAVNKQRRDAPANAKSEFPNDESIPNAQSRNPKQEDQPLRT